MEGEGQSASHHDPVRQLLHLRDHRLPTLRHRSDSRIQSRSQPWQSRLYAEFGRSAISPGGRVDSPECQNHRKSREGREIGRINASFRLPKSSDEPDIGIAGSGLTVRQENMGTMLWGLWIRGVFVWSWGRDLDFLHIGGRGLTWTRCSMYLIQD
jgi:hypothetical protein